MIGTYDNAWECGYRAGLNNNLRKAPAYFGSEDVKAVWLEGYDEGIADLMSARVPCGKCHGTGEAGSGSPFECSHCGGTGEHVWRTEK